MRARWFKRPTGFVDAVDAKPTDTRLTDALRRIAAEFARRHIERKTARLLTSNVLRVVANTEQRVQIVLSGKPNRRKSDFLLRSPPPKSTKEDL